MKEGVLLLCHIHQVAVSRARSTLGDAVRQTGNGAISLLAKRSRTSPAASSGKSSCTHRSMRCFPLICVRGAGGDDSDATSRTVGMATCADRHEHNTVLAGSKTRFVDSVLFCSTFRSFLFCSFGVSRDGLEVCVVGGVLAGEALHDVHRMNDHDSTEDQAMH